MDTFSALSEPTRRNIVELLAGRGQMPATAIAKQFKTSGAAVSQHLKVLREAQLVVAVKHGQQRFYRINPQKMIELEHWANHIARRWEERFDRLDELLDREKKKILHSYRLQLTNSAKGKPTRRGKG